MSELVGKSIGPYQILEQIGRGGMASVFKAYHPTTDRLVAVKTLPPELASNPDFRIRFEREARIVANLNHIHIVPVFDYGQDRDVAYLVMPYIPTGTLKEHLRSGPLTIKETTRFLFQIASAVHYAHQRGVIHRDIKPANVLLDDSHNALLNDFGLTRMIEDVTSLTGSRILGTPAYMSPEQGQGHEIDARSDIYSLGIMLYEMLVGDVPFSADTPLAVIFKHVNEPLPPLRMVRPGLSSAVEQVLQHSLEKSPDRRFQTAKELASAWRAAISDSPAVGRKNRSIHLRVPIDDAPTYSGPTPDLSTALLPEAESPPKAKRKREQPKDRSSWLLIILLTLVVGGLFTLFAILSSNVDQGSSGKRTTDPNIVSGIVVAYQNLPRGMVIPENAVGFAYVPINVMTNSAYTDPADVVGLTVRSDIPRGGFIYEHSVYRNVRQVGSPVGTPQPTMHSPFPTVERIVISRPDAVEFALELSPQVNVPAGVSPGDSVDIVATTSQQDISLVTTKPISHDAIVTRRTEVQLVLLVSPQESLQLSNSVAQGDQITIMGRAVGDPNIGSAPEINLALILQNQATPTPAP